MSETIMPVLRSVYIMVMLAYMLRGSFGQSRGAVPQIRRLAPKESHFVVTNKTEACKNLTEIILIEGRQFVLQSVSAQVSTDAFYSDGNVVKCRPELLNLPVYNLTLRLAMGTMDWMDYLNYEFLDDMTNTPPEFSVPSLTFAIPRDLYEIGNAANYLHDIGVTFDVTDSDPGDAGRVDVFTEAIWPDTEVPFKVIRYNGTYLLNLTGSLQHKISPYHFLLTASDNGTPGQIVHVNVMVTLHDRPEFLPPLSPTGVAMVTVNEDIPASTYILKIGARDNDTADTELRYLIVNRLPEIPKKIQLFTLKGNRLNTAPNIGSHFDIDRMEKPTLMFLLTVSVDDGLLTSTTSIVINIRDVNDNYPEFYNTTVSRNVIESTPGGALLLQMKAKDNDKTSPNNKITYNLSGNGSSQFRLNASNGALRVASNRKLDYKRQPFYSLTVTATDGGLPVPKSTSASVKIIVDTAPIFIKPTQPRTVQWLPENITNNTSIYKFEAIDKDGIDKGSLVSYNIVGVWPESARPLFEILGDTLKVTTRAKPEMFDMESNETVSSYIVQISASDGTYITRTALQLKVQDINDHAPVFDEPEYSTTIRNTFKAGDTVISVSASDGDLTSPNNAITYSLTGKGSSHFTIDTGNGSITLTSPLSLKVTSKAVYHLKVTATDGGSPENSATVPLTITITTADEEFILMAVLAPVILVLLLLAMLAIVLIWYFKIYKKKSMEKPKTSKRAHHSSKHNSKTHTPPTSDSYSCPLYGSSHHQISLPLSSYTSLVRSAYERDQSQRDQHTWNQSTWYQRDWVFLVPAFYRNSFSPRNDSLKNPYKY